MENKNRDIKVQMDIFSADGLPREEMLRMELKKRELKAQRRHSRPGSMLVARLRQEAYPGVSPQDERSAVERLFVNA